MDNRYYFDKELLKKNINTWENSLLNKNLTKEQKESLIECISYFKSYLIGKKVTPTIKEVKLSNILGKMKKDFNSIDKRLFGYINSLENLLEYNLYDESYYSDTIPSRIVNNSLEIYSEFLPGLYNTAINFINDDRHLINFSSNTNLRSICIKPIGVQTPFVNVSDYKRRPIIFIHELQHAVEIKKKYRIHEYSSETVPILLETLYIDKMIENKDFKSVNLYYDRINSTLLELRKLNAYFSSLQDLEKYNFEVSKHKLVNILIANKFIKNENRYLGAYNFDMKLALNYINSFIKSINIRSMFYEDKKRGRKFLENFWEAEYVGFNSVLLSSMSFENYLKEIEQKKKILK